MKAQLNDLLQKEMDRKDFLKHVGIGFAALIGVTAVVKAISPSSGAKVGGYGSTVYGGKRKA